MCVGVSVWLGWSGISVAGWNNTHRTKNNTTNVVIQQNSRKLLMMDILMSETCWAHKKWNKIKSDIKLVFYSSTVLFLELTSTNLSNYYLRRQRPTHTHTHTHIQLKGNVTLRLNILIFVSVPHTDPLPVESVTNWQKYRAYSPKYSIQNYSRLRFVIFQFCNFVTMFSRATFISRADVTSLSIETIIILYQFSWRLIMSVTNIPAHHAKNCTLHGTLYFSPGYAPYMLLQFW